MKRRLALMQQRGSQRLNRIGNSPMVAVESPMEPRSHGQNWAKMMKAARQETTPEVDVVSVVLEQIRRQPIPSVWNQDRFVIMAAGASTLVAACLLMMVWSSREALMDPSSAAFRPIEVAFSDRR